MSNQQRNSQPATKKNNSENQAPSPRKQPPDRGIPPKTDSYRNPK